MLFQMTSRPPHPHHHGEDEATACQQEPTFVGLLGNLQTVHHERAHQAGSDGQGQGPVHHAVPRLLPCSSQIGQHNADNQGGFHTFAQRNDKRLKHDPLGSSTTSKQQGFNTT